MASKKDEAKAFKKLKETYSGAVKLSCNMWRFSRENVSITYQAYTDTPSSIVSDSFQDPMDAVDDLIKKVSKYENSTV